MVLKCVSVCIAGVLGAGYLAGRGNVPVPARLKNTKRKLVGTKRAFRALKEDQVLVCYVARDAEPRVTEPLQRQCMEKGLEIVYVDSMKQLGRYCGIDVGAAAAAILK